MRSGPPALLAAALLLQACAGPEEPPVGANNAAPSPASATEADGDGTATTADGELDFGAIEGSWSGRIDMVIFGQNPAGSQRIDVEFQASAARSAQIGTLDWFTTAGEIICTPTLSAIEASPPQYVVRERIPDDQTEDCAPGRITFTHPPGAEVLEVMVRWRDVTGEGVLNRTEGS